MSTADLPAERVPHRLASLWRSAALASTLIVAACGGGGGDAGRSPFPAPTPSPSAPPPAPAPSTGGQSFEPSSSYAARCVAPRPAGAIDPFTGQAYGDQGGSRRTEKLWVRSWLDETYLWYDEIPNYDESDFSGAVDYFGVLKTNATTASGRPRDQFHFTYDTDEWADLSLAGVALGYGALLVLESALPPREIVVAHVQPGSPAAAAGLRRGDRLIEADGVDVADGDDVDTLNAALFPDRASTHRFTVVDGSGGAERRITMTAAPVTEQPVGTVRTVTSGGSRIGYLQFDTHIATAEGALVDAVRRLGAGGPLDDLVLDLRYNGGGMLAIASQLAYMVAGPTRTAGRTFEQLVFNDKDPFDAAGEAARTPFYATTLGFSLEAGAALPTLDLPRVYVLTGEGTCSASEAIMNGLRGVGVEVVQIGDTTCGKPYGFFPTDNCGTTYFAVQFSGVNDRGFGDYADGFVPGGSGGNGVPGCRVGDDYAHALGDPAEARFATALRHRAGGGCGDANGSSMERPTSATGAAGTKPQLLRHPVRENRYLLRTGSR